MAVRAPRISLTTTGAIDWAAAICRAVDSVSPDANAWLNADAARTHANTGRDADAGCTGTNSRSDAHTARTRLPDAAGWCAIRVTINRGFSR